MFLHATNRPVRAPEQRPVSGYVAEIQGLRTVALLLVATFHIWSGGISGGVDIFLLVSAYLMTRSLTNAAEQGRTTRALRVTVRKFARIVPAAGATILLTLVAVWLVVPQRNWEGFNTDAIAAATYTMNFHLQSVSADYYDMNRLWTSPFQQFWSLAIQGQVFILWPLLHLLTEFVSRTLRLPLRPALTVLFGLIGIASFVHARELIALDFASAYFDTLGRLWEFAAGSLLALVQPWLRVTDRARDALTWLGLAGVVSCGFVIPDDAMFPGTWALWPVLSAACIIVGAGATTPGLAARFLSSRPLAVMGGYSYALYLVHWPILVISLQANHRSTVDWLSGSVILIASVLASIALTRFVERPCARLVAVPRVSAPHPDPADDRRPRWGFWPRSIAMIAASILPAVLASSTALGVTEQSRQAAEEAIHTADYATLGAQDPGGRIDPPLLPDDLIVRTIWTESGEDCHDDDPYRTEMCYEYGDVENASRTILVLGNSHSMQYNGMLLETVQRHPDWALRTQVSPGCYFTPPSVFDDDGSLLDTFLGESDCERVWEQATRYVFEQSPDLVVVLGSNSATEDVDNIPEGLPEWIDHIAGNEGTDVVAVRDNPRFPMQPYDCAMANGFGAPECAGSPPPPDPALDDHADRIRAAGGIWVDLTPTICPDGSCPPSMGGVVTYIDDNHLSEPFARSMAGVFTSEVTTAIDWWPLHTFE
ncbi:acyltransferase [Pseudoclavibacter chungangensis]|uniref:Acyltransferase n=1 Tax=Pseudoclavibacter chungangensis TaxID=587635 RepID=A0A7J5C0Y9_9MICO|nr:acyltransferase family protein [Pseudoclavibacter chungangensis]KAB1659470.1 acyltransferase [Pseudoclavibacter chungangensis]NYJ67673.1 peptidoglycan/LPS O-acetylase OafA/YrhL [Pseudoclavibacter chungangensis]